MWGFKGVGEGEWRRRERGNREKLALFPDEGESGRCFKCNRGKLQVECIFLSQYIE